MVAFRRLIAFIATVIVVGALLVPLLPLGASAEPPEGNPSYDNANGVPFRLGALPENAEALQRVPYHVPFQQQSGAPAPDSVTATGQLLPAVVDLSSDMPPVASQGSLGSCTAWSIGYYYQGFQQKREQGWSHSDASARYSASFVYNQINGGKDGGSTPAGAMNLLVNKGAATQAVFPNTTNYLQQPDLYQLQAALPYTVGSWSYFLRGDVDGMRSWLATGDAVSLMIRVYSEFYTPTSACSKTIDVPASGSKYYGLHQITLVGYDDSRQAFKLVNSWGTGWGCSGYAWISYDLVRSYAEYGYTMSPKPDTLGILTGQVTANGQPVAGAQVSTGGYAINTASDGRYTLAVPAGRQTAQVSANALAGSSYGITMTGGRTTILNVTLGGSTPSTATVTGTVTDAQSGATIQGATVAASGVSTTTDANGKYTLSGLPGGNTTLAVTATGFQNDSRTLSLTGGQAFQVNVAMQPAAPAPTPTPEPTPSPTPTPEPPPAPTTGVLSGTARNAANGNPIANALVKAADRSTITGEDGRFSFADMAPGAVVVTVDADTFQPASLQADVTAGGEAIVDAQLQPLPGEARVQVTSSITGAPIAGATVSLADRVVETGPDGWVSIDDLAPGSYTVVAQASAHTKNSAQVAVESGGVAEITVALKSAPGAVVVWVIESNGKASASANVTVGDVTAKTDKSGMATIVLPAGTYEALASKGKQASTSLSFSVTPGDVTTITLTLSR